MTRRLITALTVIACFTATLQAQVPYDPVAQQLAAFLVVNCNNLSDELCYDFALIDDDGSHVIYFPSPGSPPRWAPDGRKLVGSFAGEIVTVSLPGAERINLTNNPANDVTPAWSPDGTKIAFSSDRDGAFDLYVMNADGSGVTRIMTGVRAWRPSWSPDGHRLAFNCADSPTATIDICAINVDGSGFTRLTDDPAEDCDPAWSPDGSTIAFSTARFGYADLVLINATDGSGLRQLTEGSIVDDPDWSRDGLRIAFDLYDASYDGSQPPFLYVMNADGTNMTLIGEGYGPSWRPVTGVGVNNRPVASFTYTCTDVTCAFSSTSADSDGAIAAYGWDFGDGTTSSEANPTHTFVAGRIYDLTLMVMDDAGALAKTEQGFSGVDKPPIASFTYTCSGLTCNFDGTGSSDPDGTIPSYAWTFGDGWVSSDGATASHRYPASGTYNVTLTVGDYGGGPPGVQSKSITVVNTPPTASFSFSCVDLTCNFDGSASSDADGMIVGYAWNFGDGGTSSGPTATHTYAGGGSDTVTLTVTDNQAATGSRSQSVTVTPPEVHVGDLDGSAQRAGSTWNASVAIAIHNANHNGVTGASVTGSWSTGGTATCTTAVSGCTVSLNAIPNKSASVTFTVTNVASAGSLYRSANNHDPDGDSNGSVITVRKP